MYFWNCIQEARLLATEQLTVVATIYRRFAPQETRGHQKNTTRTLCRVAQRTDCEALTPGCASPSATALELMVKSGSRFTQKGLAMMKPGLALVVIGIVPLLLFCQQSPKSSAPSGQKTQKAAAEKYEPIESSEYKISMDLSGRVSWDADGLANGGPVVSLSFGGHQVALQDNMIRDGLLATKEYGKIMLKSSLNGFQLLLTPTQQKKIKALLKQ